MSRITMAHTMRHHITPKSHFVQLGLESLDTYYLGTDTDLHKGYHPFLPLRVSCCLADSVSFYPVCLLNNLLGVQ